MTVPSVESHAASTDQGDRVHPKRRHPVWDVYDEYRTVYYNVKAFARRLRQIRRLGFWMDLVLAVFTPTSAVAGLFFWDTAYGRLTWNVLISIAAVVAVAKPLLNLDEKSERILRASSGFTLLYHDLRRLVTSVSQHQDYLPAHRRAFSNILAKKRRLATEIPLASMSRREQETLYNEVNQELPVSRFFVPEVQQ